MKSYSIATVPGDGIGPEVLRVAVDALTAVSDRHGFQLTFHEVPFGASHYLANGVLWSDQIENDLAAADAILLGAVGDPAVSPGVLERGIIVRLRDSFRQCVNVRPISVYPGVRNPYLFDTQNCDLVIIRENSEGSYASEGTMVHRGTTNAVAVQESVNTYSAIAQALEFGFGLAQGRRGGLTVCHKTNIMVAAGNLWMQVLQDLSPRYPDVVLDYVHVDAMSYHLMTNPGRFDVIVTDNLFGDIISDVAAVVQGGLGLAASANINLDGQKPSMFEPVHGSAPDIAGQGIANPIGAVLSAVLCLAHLGETEAATALESATAQVMRKAATATGTGEIRAGILKHLHDGSFDADGPTPLARIGELTRRGVAPPTLAEAGDSALHA